MARRNPVIALLWGVGLAAVLGQAWTARAAEPMIPVGPPAVETELIPGSLVISGGGKLEDSVLQRFLELAGGDEARLILIPTASEQAGDEARQADWTEEWKRRGVADVQVLHAESRQVAMDADFARPLQQATAVWIGGGQQSRLAEAYVGTPVETALHAVLERGGVIGGTSAGAAIMSRVMIQQGNPQPVIAQGWGFLSDVIIDQHFSERNRLPRLRTAVLQHRRQVGLGIDEATAVEIRGRSIRVLGSGRVTAVIAEPDGNECLNVVARSGEMIDLIALRRAAAVRVTGGFPPASPGTVRVPQGALLIVGGGGMPRDVVDRFVELAGGPQARIVILPTALADRDARQSGVPRFFRDSNVARIDVLPQRSRDEVESDEFVNLLDQATGVWFGGGRQWRFVDAYAGTRAYSAIWRVLLRGGVIGGSSAGASIQAEYLVRGNPLGNTDMMALGYQQGFGFLPGAAVDQHFAQRRRFADLAGVVDRHPQYLGIGIDEATALVVRGSAAEIIGRGLAHFYVSSLRSPGEVRPTFSVPSGDAFDFERNWPVAGPPPLPEN